MVDALGVRGHDEEAGAMVQSEASATWAKQTECTMAPGSPGMRCVTAYVRRDETGRDETRLVETVGAGAVVTVEVKCAAHD